MLGGKRREHWTYITCHCLFVRSFIDSFIQHLVFEPLLRGRPCVVHSSEQKTRSLSCRACITVWGVTQNRRSEYIVS